MQIRIGYDIVTRQSAPTPMVLTLHTRPELRPALTRPDELRVTPGVPTHEYTDSFGNRCVRIVAPAGPIRFQTDARIEDDGGVVRVGARVLGAGHRAGTRQRVGLGPEQGADVRVAHVDERVAVDPHRARPVLGPDRRQAHDVSRARRRRNRCSA